MPNHDRQESPETNNLKVRSYNPTTNYFRLDCRLLDFFLPLVGPLAITLYCVYARLQNRNQGFAFPSIGRLTEILGVSKWTLYRANKKLQRYRLLRIEKCTGKASRYFVLEPKVTHDILEALEKAGRKPLISIGSSTGATGSISDTGSTSATTRCSTSATTTGSTRGPLNRSRETDQVETDQQQHRGPRSGTGSGGGTEDVDVVEEEDFSNPPFSESGPAKAPSNEEWLEEMADSFISYATGNNPEVELDKSKVLRVIGRIRAEYPDGGIRISRALNLFGCQQSQVQNPLGWFTSACRETWKFPTE